MGDLSKFSDEDMLNLVSSDIEEELKKRGYVCGWHKKEEYVGAIYILVNPAFPNLVKIGYADDVQKRLKSLNSNSGLPDPYHCYAYYKVKKRLEDLKLHTLIDSLDSDLRHAKNREFYEMTPEKAFNILSAIAQINGNEDLLISNPFEDSYFDEKQQSVSKEKTDTTQEKIRRANFRFENLNIPIGSTLVFVKDTNITCKTVDNLNHVEYQGHTYSLSKLTEIFFDDGYRRNGSLWFTYNGEILWDIRNRIEGVRIKSKDAPKAQVFRFHKVGIPVGSVLSFKPKPTIKCVTVDNNLSVKYQEKVYTITELATYLYQKEFNSKDNYKTGVKYFLYNGKTLKQLIHET